jgi:SAM-dependent methyltransferase
MRSMIAIRRLVTLRCMPDWQERVTRESPPAIRAEHELRYGLAAPLVRGAALWCDLGCGSGVAGRAALHQGEPPTRVVLVDVAEDALADAGRELGVDDPLTLQADLADADDVARVRAELLEHAGEGDRVITCFETIEHLQSFVPLLRMLVDLAEQHDFTVLGSVPNDAFWSMQNPHHQTVWGEGAFDELRSLLPADHVVLHQLALQGSAVAADAPASHDVTASVDPDGVASHFLFVIGPRSGDVAPGARVVQADLEEQRRWEREREAFLASLQPEVEKLRNEVRTMSDEFADWRGYIHELEGKLGLPLSGVERGQEAPRASENGAGAADADATQPLKDSDATEPRKDADATQPLEDPSKNA